MKHLLALATFVAAGCSGGGGGGGDDPPATPVAAADVVLVSEGPALDYDAAAFERDDGATVIVFSRFETAVFAGTLVATSSLSGAAPFSAPAVLDVGLAAPLQAGPSALVHEGTWLYFMAGDSSLNDTRLHRSELTGAVFGTAQQLVLDDPFGGMFAWPHPAVLPDESIALAYDHYQQSPYIAFGDGLSFGGDEDLGNGVQGRVAAFGDGSMAFTYQNGDPSDMIAFVRLAEIDGDWSDAAPITDSPNVHDAMPFARLDGDVDLYYIHAGSGAFAIHRRRVSSDGDLGREELVVEEAFGTTTQPRPHRLADGRILLTFTKQVTSQIDYDVAFAILDGDS